MPHYALNAEPGRYDVRGFPAGLAALVVVYPFAHMFEADLPDGVSLWHEPGHDFVGSGTEVLLLLMVVAAVGWHLVRVVAKRQEPPGVRRLGHGSCPKRAPPGDGNGRGDRGVLD